MNISKSSRTMDLIPIVLRIYKHAAINNLPCPTYEDVMNTTSCTEHEINSANVYLIRKGDIVVEKIAARRRIYISSIKAFTDWTARKVHEEIRKNRKCLVCTKQFMSSGSGNRICSRCRDREGHGLWGAQWE